MRNSTLKQLTDLYGMPHVDMFSHDCWRVWWRNVHIHDGACSGDLSAQGESIEEAATRALKLTEKKDVVVVTDGQCRKCKESVDF